MNDPILVYLSDDEKAFAVDVAKSRNAVQRSAEQADGNVISSLKADLRGAYVKD